MEKQSEKSPVNRRKALTRLGLGVAVAYTAPTILHLDRSAHAVNPSCNGNSKGNPWCNTGGKGGKKGK
ncbi:MAG: hypothetical protein ACI9JL_004073 [Paracoccaceae bacterium]|jgi:hypothetical protein